MTNVLRHKFGRFAFCAVLLLVFSAGNLYAQDPINQNGGFEDFDLGAPGTSSAWYFQISDVADATAEIVDDPVHEGSRALAVTVAGTAGANLQFSNQNIAVSGPGTYHYSAWARASEDGARIQSIADHHGGTYSWFHNVTTELTTEWTEITFTFEVPEDVAGVPVTAIRATHILKFAENVGKTIYLDDVRVWKEEEGPQPDFAWDFEDDDLGDWQFQTELPYDLSTTGEITDDRAFMGTRSVRMTIGDGGSKSALINDEQQVEPGDVITYHVWVGADELAGINGIQPFVQHGAGWTWVDQWYGSGNLTVDDWNVITFTVPEGVGETQRIGLQVTGYDLNSTATVFIDYITIEKAGQEPQPGEMVPVTRWGFNNVGQGWELTVGDPGDVSAIGTAPPTGWMALRGEFDDIEPQVGEALVITGQLELIGGGLTTSTTTNYPALRYGVYQDSSRAGELVGDAWDGEAGPGGNYGYLFTAPSGTGGDVAWQGVGQRGTVGGIRDRTWYSTNGPRDYVLSNVLHRPQNAQATAGLYNFAFSIAPLENGSREIRFYLVKEDNSYYWADIVVDDTTDQVTSFNSINFALSADISATGVALYDVMVGLGDPIELPEAPVAIGEIINPNGSFQNSMLGDQQAAGWSFQTASGGEGRFTIVSDSQDSDSLALRVDILNLGTNADDWNVEAVNEPFEVQQGATYQYTVWLKADSDGRAARIILGQPQTGNWARAITSDVTLTTEWQRFAFIHTASASEANTGMRAPISLNMPGNANPSAGDTTRIYIDNLSVIKIAEGEFSLPDDVINFWTFEDVSPADTNANGHIVHDGWANGSQPEAGTAVLTTERAYNSSKAVRLQSTETSAEVRFRRHGPYPDLTEDWLFRFRIYISSEDLENLDHIRPYYQDANFQQPGPASDTLWANEIIPNAWNVFEFRIPDGYTPPMNRIGIVVQATSAEAMPVVYVDQVWIRNSPQSGVDVEPSDLPYQFELAQNYPNPFNPTTTIEYEIDNHVHVNLAIYNLLGQRVATLVDGEQVAGRYKVQFDATNLASGVYFYRLTAGTNVMTRRMMLVK